MLKNIRGFRDYNIDAVVKFGGSLLINEHLTTNAIASLEDTLSTDKKILVIPGGGPTDKTIEALDRKHHFVGDTHHKACARAQDQTGLIICDPSLSKKLRACETLDEARQISSKGLIPVLLPSSIIFSVDPIDRTWEITSDAMAAWFAWLVSAPQVIILTDVNGIYTPDSEIRDGVPITEVNSSQLLDWGQTAVDVCFPHFILKKGITGWVIHGGHAARLSAVLTGQPTMGTKIIPQ